VRVLLPGTGCFGGGGGGGFCRPSLRKRLRDLFVLLYISFKIFIIKQCQQANIIGHRHRSI
jgi:hypothetical protein